MTAPVVPWPAPETGTDHPREEPPPEDPAAGERALAALAGRLRTAVGQVDAPDVVFALSRRGRRLVHSGGTGPVPPLPRYLLRYELGSASKTFTGLLLARLVRSGRLTGGEHAAALLDPGRPPAAEHPATLAHLVTHTSGLPPLPADFYPQALARWSTNPYAGYSAERTVAAFLRARPRHRPGSRWRYSNFGAATLGYALAAAAGTSWEALLIEQVLRPLALTGTTLRPVPDGADAQGHRADGSTPTPPLLIPGFQPAGAVRATPHDLLTYLEAHLRPGDSPLAAALRSVRVPVLRRGPAHGHTHTLTWFCHPTPRGPLYFHAGATSGQQAFLAFQPRTGTALAAVATRRHRRADRFVPLAYDIAHDIAHDLLGQERPDS